MKRRVLSSILIVGMAAGGQADGADREAPPTVDEKTAREYDGFRQRLLGQVRKLTAQAVKRYKLRDDQKQVVERLADRHLEQFLRNHGLEMFALDQRLRALGRLLREENISWQEVPGDVKRDLAEVAMPMIDAAQKELEGLAEGFAKVLAPHQMDQLERERERMKLAFRMARLQARIMSGQAAPGGAAPAGGHGPRTRPSRPPAAGGDRWERYVKWFVERHRLDEVQKLRAMDLLREYRARAEKLPGESGSAPTSRPRPKQRSVESFRRRLAGLRQHHRSVNALFEQLKAELEKIPTPVQRKLGAQGPAIGGGKGPYPGEGIPESREGRPR